MRPGGFYTRGFIRTYASFLGLDGERLAEDYRESIEGASREWTPPPEPSGMVRLPAGGGPSRRLGWAGGLIVVTLAIVAIVVIPGGGGGAGVTTGASNDEPASDQDSKLESRPAPRRGVSMQLAASAEVWVCVLDAKGRRLLDGQILESGAEAGPFRSDSFTVSFGNGEVSMMIDGKEAELSPTSSPIGYSIDATGRLSELSEAERPTCT
jgi:cytoskeleton protein RodZ